jgi:energy-coupling factor transporter ATP-binding protein EcfA2
MEQSSGVEAFDVFLSHSSGESDLVERVAEKLQACGVRPWLDAWQLAGGDRFQDKIGKGIERSSSCAVFLGASGFKPWVQEEIDFAADRAVTEGEGFRLFLVLLPGAPDPLDRASLPPGLRIRSWVDLRNGIDAGLQSLINAVKGEIPTRYEPAAVESAVQPYKGLTPFTYEDAEFFFGREQDVQQLLELLRGGRFLAVVGPSGAGKSSLARAGLLPALAAARLPGSDTWVHRTFRPGAQPLTRLAAALGSLLPGRSMTSLLDQLEDHRTLDLEVHKILSDRPDEARLIWVIDQFEELFAVCKDGTQRNRFLEALLYAATVPGGRNVVVLTMRSDFYSAASEYAELSVLLGGRHHLVSPLDASQLRRAVEDPARLVGLEFQPGLVDRILSEVSSDAAALPLLQDGLLELWWRRRYGLLTHDAYTTIGGVGGSLARRAEDLYANLAPSQQEQIRFILTHRLIRVEEGSEPVARTARIADVVPHGADADHTRELVDLLVGARLVSVMRDDEANVDVVEVAHETLIRAWPRLAGWIDEDRAELIEHRLMTEAAREWETRQRDPGYLFRGDRLRTVIRSAARFGYELNDVERSFLRASVRRERAAVRTRYFGQAGGGAVGMAVGFAAALSILLEARTVDTNLAVLLFLAAWPLGLMVGLTVGLGLWFTRTNQHWRSLLLGGAGAVVGAVSYSAVMYAVFLAPGQAFAPSHLATGALLAAPLGFAVGAWDRRAQRASGLVIAGVVAAALAMIPGRIDAVWWSVPLAGLLLGGFSAAGFAVVHVRPEDQSIFEFTEDG